MIQIDILYGNSYVQADDRERAARAAESVLKDYSAQECHNEYLRQWLEYDDESPMTGLAVVWIEARNAADIALTQGWSKPDGASCTISI